MARRDRDAGSPADRAVISADTDVGELMAFSNARGPSIVLLRRQQQRRAHEIAALILANLDDVAEDLRAGAIVVSRIGPCWVVPVRPQVCAKHQFNGMIHHETTSAGHASSRRRIRR